jgi:hypothetical protein
VDLQDYVGVARQDPALRFLIIGGDAVAAHGHMRATFDVDFLVERDEREEWLRRLLSRGSKRNCF